MADFKYVMLRVEHAGIVRHMPVIFPDIIVHADMAAVVSAIVASDVPKSKVTVDSAGLVNLGRCETYDKSTTLDLESQPERDDRIINTYPYFHGIQME